MKKLQTLILVLVAGWSSAQCTFNNTLISTITPTCPGTTTVPCIMGGQYVQVNVTSGNTYTFATCGGATFDTQITLFNTAGTATLGYNDDGCGLQSTVTYVSTFTGVLNVLVDNYPCTNGTTCATMTINCTTGGGGGGPGGCSGGTANSSCALADPFCTSITYNLCNTTGVPSIGGGGTYGCLGSAPNPAFYYLNISTSGNINISINQYSNAGTPIDVDYIVWGPFASQAAMCAGLSSTNIESCSYSASASETATITGAVVGEWYMMMLTNFSGIAGYIDVAQSGGTGATNCSIISPCTITGAMTPVSCNGGSNGTITATVTGGSPYTVNVVNSGGTTVATQTGTGTTYNFTGLPAGTYTLNLTASGPCTNTTTVTITQPTVLTATSSHTNLTCATPCNGTLNASGAGGTAPYTYSWSGGLGAGASKTGVCAGTYTCTVTDANGCTTTTTQTITAPPAVTASVTTTPTTCFGACTGSITATGGGGTGALTYTWSGGIGTGAVQTNECAGTYTVTVTDANGCTATATGTIANGPNIVPSFTVAGNQCQNSNTFNFTNTSTGATSYSWNFGAGATPATSTATNPSGVTYSTTGSHTVTLTATNGGCSQTTTMNITTFANPTASATNTAPPCNTATGTVSASGAGGLPAYTYSWSGGLGTTQNVSGVAPGTYTVTVTDANGCTGTASTTVPVGPTLSVTTSSVGATCGASNGSVTANGVGGGTLTYTWYSNAGLTTVIGSGATLGSLPAGTYYVQVTSSTGCVVSTSATVNNAAGPTISAVTNSNVTCAGLCNGSGTATVSGVAPLNISWSNGATTATTNTLCAGSQCVTVTDGNGCTANTCITITAPPALNVSVTGTNPLCNGSCNGAVSSLVTGGAGGTTYSWSNGSTAANLTAVCAGAYSLTVTDANGCTATANTTLTNPPAIVFNPSIVSPPNCFGNCDATINSSATGGTGTLDYTIIGIGTGPVFINVCAGSYTITATDDNGCTATSPVTVTNPPALTVALSSVNASCTAANGSATAVPSGGTGPYTFLWSNGATTAVNGGLASGSYTVTVTDSKGCTTTGTINVGNNAGGTATASTVANVSCFGGSNGQATVTMAGGTPGFTFSWNTTPVQTTQNATGLTAGTYTATVTDANGCTSTSTTTITQPTALTLTANGTDVLCNGGNTGTANASAAGGTGAITYAWTPSGGTAASATGLTAGVYTITITDANGCTMNTNVTINQPPALTTTIGMIPTKCDGSCDGEASVTAAGGFGTYTYQWNDPLSQTLAGAFNLCAGPIQVTVTDQNGCTSIANTTVTSPTPLTQTTVIVDAHCGNNDGSACVTITGGTTPYTYLWNNGSTTNCVNSVVAGGYVLDVTDAAGCLLSVSAPIADLGAPSSSISASTNVSCFAGNNGSATVTTVGGTLPYTILWDAAAGSQTTPTASNLTAGTYGVTVTDGTGCNSSATITITEPSILVLNVNEYNPNCFGYCDGSLAAHLTGGTLPYTYAWLNSGGGGAGATDSISGLCDDTYTLNVTDGNGCPVTSTHTLIEPVPVSANVTSTNVQCFGACDGTGTATPLTGIAPFTFNWSNGQTTSNATGLCPGTTNVTVTDDDGCFAAYSVVITEPTVLDVVISSSGMVSCTGLCDGFADINITGGTAPYTVLWSNGVTSTLNNGLCIGEYIATVTDANGCTDTVSIDIIEPGGLTISMASTNLVCNSQCDGNATATISGGTLPYTILWDDPTLSTTNSITNVCAGFYTITVTDANGCFLSQSVNITQPSALTMNIGTTDANCGQNNGMICATPFGGVAPISISWNDPAAQTTPCAQNILSGCYTVTMTDFNGCVIDSLICINDIAGPTLTLTSSSDVTCFGYGDGSIAVMGSGGAGALSYEWVDGSGAVIVSLTDQTSTTTLNGDTYGVTVTDTAGCQASITQIINEPASFVSAISAQTDVTCNAACDGTATVTSVGGNGGNVILWSSGAATGAANNTGLCAGVTTVTITDALGCTTSTSVTINEPAPLVSGITGFTDVDCNGNCNGAITTAVTGGTVPYTYAWTGGAGVSSFANSLCAGSYTVTVTDNNGCTSTSTQVIAEPTLLVAAALSTDASCGMCNGLSLANGSGGTAPYTYAWPSGATPTLPNNSDLCIGSHTVTVTDNNGCTATATVTIADQPGPTIASLVFAEPSCFGGSDGTATVAVSGGTGTVAILWNDPASQTTTLASGLQAGNICVTLTDANNCTATNCITITQPSALAAVADLDQTICSGTSAQIFGSGAGGTAPYTVTWTSGTTGSATMVTVTPTTTTTYCMFVTDDKGCISPPDCATITVTPPLSISVIADPTICDGQTTTLLADAAGGNGGPYTFTWVDDAGNPVASTTSGSNSTANVSPNATTNYIVTVDDGCTVPTANDNVTVNVNPLPTLFINVVDRDGCSPHAAQFILNTDIGTSFEYDFNCDGNVDLTSPSLNESNVYDVPGTYDVCVTAISAAGCTTTVSQSAFITSHPNPIANFELTPAVTTIMTPEITFTESSTGEVMYDWNFGDGDTIGGNQGTSIPNGSNEGQTSGIIEMPVHVYQDTGTYLVTLLVTNEFGCTDTATHYVTIEGEYAIYVPNSFTPNGDGFNDIFIPQGLMLDVEHFDMFVFNRWGEIIFESHTPNTGWDGMHKGVKSKEDVYVWKIKARDHKGIDHEYIGHVTLLR